MSSRFPPRLRCTDDVASLVPESVASENYVLPLFQSEGVLILAVAQPLTTELAEGLRFILNCEIEERIEPQSDIDEAIEWTYGSPDGDLS